MNPRTERDRASYKLKAKAFLERHPFCQFWIAEHGITESEVSENGMAHGPKHAIYLPHSDQIHHRNKRTGRRLLDERFWMAVSSPSHRWIEDHKTAARLKGYLLPIQADDNGRWGDGNQGLHTDALLKSRAARRRPSP